MHAMAEQPIQEVVDGGCGGDAVNFRFDRGLLSRGEKVARLGKNSCYYSLFSGFTDKGEGLAAKDGAYSGGNVRR